MSGRNHINRGAPLRPSDNSHHHHHHSLADSRLHQLAQAHQQQRRQHESTILQDRIAIQHREIQALLLENQRLVATHLALKEDLALAQRDLHQLSAVAKDVKAERDARVREVYERSLKLNSEVRAIDAMSADLVQVKTDVQKLTVHRQELNKELLDINDSIAEARKEANQVGIIMAEIEALQREIQRGRAAIECEKKNKTINFEQGQMMEKNMILMAREIDKLRAELDNTEKRAKAAAAANPGPGYAANYGTAEVGGYEGITFRDSYGMQKVEGSSDNGPPYVTRSMPSGPYDTQQAHANG